MDQSSLSTDSSNLNVSDTDSTPGPHEVASSESATPASGFMEPADIASALRQLTAKINESVCVKEKVDTLQKENMALRAELEKARRELALAKSEIDSSKRLLDERSNSLAIERSLRVSLEKELDKTKPPRAPDLVIGSSLIRDLDAELYVNTEIIAESGACPEDLQKLLEEKAHEGKHYDRVIVVAGGNQLSFNEEDDSNIKETIDSMEKCLTAAKSISTKVAVCELPPRAQTDCAPERIRHLNAELCCLAEKCQSDFIKTNHKFYLNDNTANDGYLDSDLIHLNLRGSSKLVECLGIKVKDGSNKLKAKKKAAYRSKSNPKSYSQALKTKEPRKDAQPTTGQNKNSQKVPRPAEQKRQLQPMKVKSFPSAPKDGITGRVKPIQAEYGFCGYCGEPGHTYTICRHEKPVTCHDCGASSHKRKYCAHYPKYVY